MPSLTLVPSQTSLLRRLVAYDLRTEAAQNTSTLHHWILASTGCHGKVLMSAHSNICQDSVIFYLHTAFSMFCRGGSCARASASTGGSDQAAVRTTAVTTGRRAR